MKKGETREFVVQALDAQRRGAARRAVALRAVKAVVRNDTSARGAISGSTAPSACSSSASMP
jgi:hypothetical protein